MDHWHKLAQNIGAQSASHEEDAAFEEVGEIDADSPEVEASTENAEVEADTEIVDAVEAVAEANASAGWCVMIGATNRSIPGRNNTLCFSPALIATEADIDAITDAVDKALGRVFG